MENGLSNNTVFCSLQDTKGFMWFGTKDGLNRFDGYTFKTFQNDPDNPTSIGDNFISRSIYEDPKGTLWIGTQKGLYRYNPELESFTLLIASKGEIRDIEMDVNGDIWYIAGLSLFKYDFDTKVSIRYNPKNIEEATSICSTTNGILWFSSPKGFLYSYDPKISAFKSHDVFAKSPSSASNWIEKLYADGNERIFIATSNQGAKIFDIKSSTYKDVLTYNKDKTEIFARDFVKESPDKYWIATESGVFIYDINTGTVINLRKSYNDPYSISDNAIYTLTRDKEGGIWAGTFFGGVNYYPKPYNSFQKYFPDYGPKSLSGNAVREICEDKKGNIWVGTEDAGLNKLNRKTGQFEHFFPLGTKSSISYTNVHGLLALDKELWIGTFEHGLDVMDLASEKIVRHYGAQAGVHAFKSNFIVTFHKTRKGEILIGTRVGLYSFNAKANNFNLIPFAPHDGFIHTILEDHTGTIWVGTIGQGLFYYNKEKTIQGNFQFNPNNKNGISSNVINGVFEDSKKNLWLATEGGGLCVLDSTRTKFKKYNTKNGFPSNTVFKVLEDNKGDFWITTTKGLVFLETNTNFVKVYTRANGLLSDQFNYNSAYKDSKGVLYFGCVKGLVAINPTQFITSTYKPPVYFTGFQIYNTEATIDGNASPLHKSISFTDTIKLKYNQSTFSIDFSALSFTSPEMIQYAFKMEGLEKDWTHIKTNRKAYFTELSPGTYTFKVKSANSSGIWNQSERKLLIHISPPFWFSTPAYLAYILLTVSIIYFLLTNYHQRTQVRNKRKLDLLENAKQKEIYRAKIEFFTNIAHEIRTPLTLIRGPMEKIIKKADEVPAIKKNLEIMQRNTDRLLQLTNQLLDFRKTETNEFSLNFVKADIVELLRDSYLLFKNAAEQRNIDFELNISVDIFYAYVDIEAFNKILSNLLNNAIIYGKSKVYVCLKDIHESDTTFTIQVKNDGYLIPTEMKEKVFETFY
ncbi:MAG: hybrid sensor histidine kinase/response regulator, partial [Daejeonella sp.]|nr:hybrid sensor histidine kinase/response regulator [Daejeonella sp.]